MNNSVSQSQSSTEMAPAVLKPSINSASNSTLTVTNNTPIMSAKAADIGAGDQTRTPSKNYPVALPTLPQLGPHRRIIEESKPNPNQSQPVGKYSRIRPTPRPVPKLFFKSILIM